MNILRISPMVVALVCALLFGVDLDSSQAQLAIPTGEISAVGSVIFPEDDEYVDEFIDESAPPPNFRRPPNGRRIPPNGHHQNGRYPHPVDSFLQAIEPFFNGDVSNTFFNPEPNFNIHHHHHQQQHSGGNFYSSGPLPPPPHIPQHHPTNNRPGKRPQPPHKNPIKFPSDVPPSANTFHHPQRPLHFNKNPFKKPSSHPQQTGLFIFYSIVQMLFRCCHNVF